MAERQKIGHDPFGGSDSNAYYPTEVLQTTDGTSIPRSYRDNIERNNNIFDIRGSGSISSRNPLAYVEELNNGINKYVQWSQRNYLTYVAAGSKPIISVETPYPVSEESTPKASPAALEVMSGLNKSDKLILAAWRKVGRESPPYKLKDFFAVSDPKEIDELSNNVFNRGSALRLLMSQMYIDRQSFIYEKYPELTPTEQETAQAILKSDNEKLKTVLRNAAQTDIHLLILKAKAVAPREDTTLTDGDKKELKELNRRFVWAKNTYDNNNKRISQLTKDPQRSFEDGVKLSGLGPELSKLTVSELSKNNVLKIYDVIAGELQKKEGSAQSSTTQNVSVGLNYPILPIPSAPLPPPQRTGTDTTTSLIPPTLFNSQATQVAFSQKPAVVVLAKPTSVPNRRPGTLTVIKT